MNKLILASLTLLILLPIRLPAGPKEKMGPEVALKKLMEGNRRFAAASPEGPHRSASRLQEVAPKQEPFATILGCADSRVPPEIIFDQGIGNLFVVRNAGNIEGDIAIGSLEYGAEHLHIPLIIVLGHKRCGAVTAAMAGGHPEGHIRSVVDAIMPAIELEKERHHDDVEHVTRANARLVAHRLSQKSDILFKLIETGKLKIIGAYYDVDSGRVTLLSDD